MKAAELRIASSPGIRIPDDATVGTELTVTARIRIHSLDEARIDITELGAEDSRYARGPITVEAVALTAEVAA